MYFALFTIGIAEVGRAIVKQYEVLGKTEGLFGGARFLKESQTATEAGRNIEFFVGLALIVFCLSCTSWSTAAGSACSSGRRARARAWRGASASTSYGHGSPSSSSPRPCSASIGGFYTGFYGGASLTIFDFNTLLLLLAMIVVGGVGSPKGAIIGTALLLYIDRTYADLDTPAWRFVWIGIIMFGVTLLTTRGLVGAACADPRATCSGAERGD